MLGSTEWSCQISGSNFQSARFWHGCAKKQGVAVPNFWFGIFDGFSFFYKI